MKACLFDTGRELKAIKSVSDEVPKFGCADLPKSISNEGDVRKSGTRRGEARQNLSPRQMTHVPQMVPTDLVWRG